MNNPDYLKKTVLAAAVSMALFSVGALAEDEEKNSAQQEIETVVVVGRKMERKLLDVTGSVSVVTADDIEKQVVTDMNQLFKYDPSIQVTGAVGSPQNIFVRGMGGNRVLMIKDGMRMNDGYTVEEAGDFVGRGFIDTDTLKQVEVAKGAASSLYGSDALSGIVVFTTKDASDYLEDGEKFAGRARAGYAGQNEQTNLGATVAFQTGAVGHLLSANYRDGKGDQNYDETREEVDVESSSLLYKAAFNLSDNDQVGFIADLYKQDTERERTLLAGPFRGLASFGYEITDESNSGEQDNESYQLNYTSERDNGFYDFLNVRLYRNETRQEDSEYVQLDIDAPMFGVLELRDMWRTSTHKQTTDGFLSNASKNLNGTHTLGFGLDLEKTKTNRESVQYREADGVPMPGYPQSESPFPKNTVDRIGAFINDEILLMDGQLTVTPGVRFDQFEMDPKGATDLDGNPYEKIDESKTSFNLGALYRVNDENSLYFQYGQGFKVPPYDLAYFHIYNNFGSYIYEILPSPDLAPEESDTWELGARGAIGNLAYTAAIYYNDYKEFISLEYLSSEIISFDPFVLSEVLQYQNIDEVVIKGAELGLTYYFANGFSVFANASYQDGKDQETKDYISTIAPLSGTVGVSYSREKWSSDIIASWADSMNKVNEGEISTSGYVVFDWLFDWQVTDRFRVNLAVNNLFDEEYTRYLSVAGRPDTTDVDYYSAAGINGSVNVSFSF
jgi:hemoglobin/transferrin/lactoferrin receptor protein